jgi:uncharacterized membrane protein YgcG
MMVTLGTATSAGAAAAGVDVDVRSPAAAAAAAAVGRTHTVCFVALRRNTNSHACGQIKTRTCCSNTATFSSCPCTRPSLAATAPQRQQQRAWQLRSRLQALRQRQARATTRARRPVPPSRNQVAPRPARAHAQLACCAPSAHVHTHRLLGGSAVEVGATSLLVSEFTPTRRQRVGSTSWRTSGSSGNGGGSSGGRRRSSTSTSNCLLGARTHPHLRVSG